MPDAGPAIALIAVIDLPRMGSTQGLSGTWFEASSSTLYALQDTGPKITQLIVAPDLQSIIVGAQLTLTGRPNPAWDGEALTHTADQFYALTVETLPLLERFDATGVYLGAVALPAHYAQQHAGNKGVESVSIEPGGAYLFVCDEEALTPDGDLSTKDAGTTVRILRRALASGQDEERAYRTEPLGPGTAVGADMGVSDVLALSSTELLVLERGFQSDYGNTVRLYRVDYSMGDDVLASPGLNLATPVLAKTLVLDLSTLPSAGVTNPGLQPNPILDNFEGLALGPTLADGQRVIFVTSDDNARATQVPRVLVLGVRGL